MKRVFTIGVSAALVILGLSSCNDFFGTIPGENYDLESTFTNRSKTEQYLNNVYSYVPEETNERNPFSQGSMAGPWTAGSLEADITWSGNPATDWALGTVYPSSQMARFYWQEYYKGISKASTFIANVDRCLDASESDRRLWKAQARALRALYYFYLFRSYGPLVLLGEDAVAVDTPIDELMMERSPVDACVKFIVDEFDAAAEILPAKYESSNVGRIDRGTCKAFKAKVLLYAASPLFNCNEMYADVRNNDGTQLFPQDKSQEQQKWQDAKTAYEEFFQEFVPSYYDLHIVESSTGGIDHYESYRQTAALADDNIKEHIFVRLAWSDMFSYQVTPYHNNCQDGNMRGGLGFGTTQEIVDMYYTDKGLRIVDDPDYAQYEYTGIPSSEYYGWPEDYKDPFEPKRTYFKQNTNKTLKQWAHREPRFYCCVTFNGSTWLKTDTSDGEVTTELNNTGNSGFAAANWDAPYTGYGDRRMAPKGGRNTSGHRVVLLRLGDMYLGYAECCSALGDYDTAIEYVNKIRNRAGVPEYGEGVDGNGFERIALSDIGLSENTADVNKIVHRERLIELSFEWNRFFDVRRWKVAGMSVGDDWYYPSYHQGGEGGDIHGMTYTADPPEFFEKRVVETRAFDNRHYFFPIPDAEIRRNPKMVQNYGWSTGETEE